jgi:phage replication O-like protein O
LENGYLRLSNELAQALARTPLNGSQFRIILTVARECYGRNGGRKMAPLSYGMIAAATGLGLRTVQREVGRLLKANVLGRDANGRRSTYGLQKNYELWATRGVGQLTDDQSTDAKLTEGESVNQPTKHSVNWPTGRRPNSLA